MKAKELRGLWLRLAGQFASPEKKSDNDSKGDDDSESGDGDDEEDDDDSDDEEDDDSDGDKPKDQPGAQAVPYRRFAEVNKARRTAERAQKKAERENATLKQQVETLNKGDQSELVKSLQAENERLTKQTEELDDEFEAMLEVALADVPDERAAMVRDIPGGPRAQFAYFNKHRTQLLGTGAKPKDDGEGEPEGGKPKGPKNERKPGGKGGSKVGSAAKSYVERQKAKAGFGTVTGT